MSTRGRRALNLLISGLVNYMKTERFLHFCSKLGRSTTHQNSPLLDGMMSKFLTNTCNMCLLIHTVSPSPAPIFTKLHVESSSPLLAFTSVNTILPCHVWPLVSACETATGRDLGSTKAGERYTWTEQVGLCWTTMSG